MTGAPGKLSSSQALTSPGRLSELLGVVQRWVDSGDTNAVTIRFGDREHTMGPAFADRPLTREAGRATMPRRAARSVRA